MPFVSPFSRATCPTCGHRFHLSEARWRDYSVKPKECPEMQKALNLPVAPSVPPDVEPSAAAAASSRVYVARNSRWWKKVCPSCRVDLPQFIADAGADERIAILGEGSTGKSHLIWAWLEQLQKLPPRLGVSVRFMDTYDLETFKPANSKDLWRQRYANHLNPQPDAAGKVPPRRLIPKDTDRPLKPPLIVRLVFSKRPIWHTLIKPFAEFRPVDLLFYDTVGENFKTREDIYVFAGYVLSASGLVFLVDPLACPELKALLATTPTSQGSTGMASDLMDRIRHVYDEEHVFANDQRLPIPTAIVLTKSDLLRDHFARDNPHAPGSHHSDYQRGFPAADIKAASEDIREYLSRAGQSGLLTLVQGNLKRYHFFACSALGREPDERKMLEGPPEPFRVLDPIFWLLCEKGHLNPAPLPPALIEDER